MTKADIDAAKQSIFPFTNWYIYFVIDSGEVIWFRYQKYISCLHSSVGLDYEVKLRMKNQITHCTSIEFTVAAKSQKKYTHHSNFKGYNLGANRVVSLKCVTSLEITWCRNANLG